MVSDKFAITVLQNNSFQKYIFSIKFKSVHFNLSLQRYVFHQRRKNSKHQEFVSCKFMNRTADFPVILLLILISITVGKRLLLLITYSFARFRAIQTFYLSHYDNYLDEKQIFCKIEQ
jgi:hypothetical protein